MDPNRFDAVVRILTTSPTRRDLARLAAGTFLGSLIVAQQDAPASGKRGKRKKRRKPPRKPAPFCAGKPDGTACGERSGGDILRCCGGSCPAPSCRPFGTRCRAGESESACRAACCSRQLGSVGEEAFCARGFFEGFCASDNDCAIDFQCVCDTCVSRPAVSTCAGESNGAPCGVDGGDVRCCEGICPQRSCRRPGESCKAGESEEACRAACCSQRLNDFGFGFLCAYSVVGETCSSDGDCGPGPRCFCGTCCRDSGELIGSGSCSDCCSGACIPGSPICA